MSLLKIQSIDLSDAHITVLFTTHWYQEDIAALSQLLLTAIPKQQIKEITQGADRESVRFSYLNAEFILNFDYYSQSCWFSAQDEISAADITALFSLLTTPSHV